jgi:hypothetical protein
LQTLQQTSEMMQQESNTKLEYIRQMKQDIEKSANACSMISS